MTTFTHCWRRFQHISCGVFFTCGSHSTRVKCSASIGGSGECGRKYFDRIVRDDKEFAQKRDYIIGNPWKRWPDIAEYRWVWPLGDDSFGIVASDRIRAPLTQAGRH